MDKKLYKKTVKRGECKMKYTKEDIYVGRKVYLTLGYNRSRNSDPNTIIESEIIKVGRKYFEIDVEKYNKPKFYIEDLKQVTEYCVDYIVYLEKQIILDQREFSNIVSNIKKVFGNYRYSEPKKLTLDQLRRIDKILKEGETND